MKKQKQKIITPEIIEMSKISITISRELKREFRKSTFLNDMSMNMAIINFMKSYIEENPVHNVVRRSGLRKPANRKKAGAVNEE